MVLVERLQRERGAVAQASAPGGSLLQEFRSSLCQNEQGCLMYTCCNELNEVQQRLVYPVQVLEQDAQRLATCQCFDKATHRHMQGTLVSQGCRPINVYIQPGEQCKVMGDFSQVPCCLGLTHHCCHHLTQFARGRLHVVGHRDACCFFHDFCQCPVAEPFPIGEAASMQDVRVVEQTALKCCNKAGLANARFTQDGDEVRMELLHDLGPNAGEQGQFISAPDQRDMLSSFLPPTRSLPPLKGRIHWHALCLALEHNCSSLAKANCLAGKPHRLLADEHFSWFRSGLQSSR